MKLGWAFPHVLGQAASKRVLDQHTHGDAVLLSILLGILEEGIGKGGGPHDQAYQAILTHQE